MAKVKNPVTIIKPDSKFVSLVDRSITVVTAEDLAGCTKIGAHAFAFCIITQIDIPNTVTLIDSSAFQGCGQLQKITLPASVRYIQNYAFISCTSLQSFTCLSTTPPVLSGVDAFTNTNNCPIYVPAESVTAYQSATNWISLASRIQAIP